MPHEKLEHGTKVTADWTSAVGEVVDTSDDGESVRVLWPATSAFGPFRQWEQRRRLQPVD